MKKQITFLLFTLLFALTSSQVIAQQDVLYLIQDGTNDSDYIANGGSLPGQDQIIKMLEADANFTVSWVKIDQAFVVTSMSTQAAGANVVSSPVNFTGFELVITSENMASSNTVFKAGNPLHPDQLTVPVIYDKAYALRGSSAALATSATSVVVRTQELSMTVVDATSPLFSGLTVSNGSSIDLFRTTADDKGNEGPYAIDVVTNLEISSTTTLLASVPQITDATTSVGINYFPTGTQVGTTADGIFAKDAISMPFSWGAMVKKDGGNITSEFLTIWRNAAYMLTGQTPPSTLYTNPVYDDYEIITQTTVYDFRDGSIIPNHTDGYVITGSPEAAAQPQTDRIKSADGRLDYRHIAGDNYHGSTYGLDMKAGSRVFIKPLGTAVVKVPLSEYSSLGLELKMPNNNNKSWIKVNGTLTSGASSSTYQQTLNATATSGQDLNEFVTVDFYSTVGNSQNLEFMAVAGAGSDIYLPYIEVTYQILQAKPQEILYVQKTGFTPASGASASTNDPIFRMFTADPNFNITVVETDANGTGISLAGYDLVIAQETFGSSDGIFKPTGPLAIKNLSIPVIYNKSWALRNGRAVTDADAAMAISPATTLTVDLANQTNPLFSGITFTGNDFMLYNETSDNFGGTGTNSVDVLNNLDISVTGTLLGTNANVTDVDKAIVVNDIPANTQLGTVATDVLPSRMIAFAFNYGAIIKGDGANITSEALTLWRNAAYVLTGLTVPSTLYVNPDYVTLSIDKVGEVSAVTSNVRAIGNRIYVSNVKSSTEVNIYSLTGALVKTIKTNENTDFSFKSGLWIATVKTFEGAKAVKLLTK
ncbi:hypothetical protein VP395_10455 [Mariniflexile soesokkakense]|uniref:Secreted protein (Por secretion system target) n=1 Tax=Mariniflexile soesokkakense TaxID=1343160 RepID=A0ABV0ADY6_9FLAO